MLAVGPGGLDKEGKRIQPSVAPGDKVLIPQVGLYFIHCVICYWGLKIGFFVGRV